MPMSKTALFRKLVTAPEILQIPMCYDAASAKALEQTGIKAISAAGYGLSGSLLGMPDIGFLTAHEMVRRLPRQDFQTSKAGRSADPAADKSDQPQDREGPRFDHIALAPWPRRRGDRMISPP
jgi:Phosphoenolpyruvate phosphomutase